MTILHVDSSILGDQSASRTISAAITDTLRAKRLESPVIYRDLATDPVPHISVDVVVGDATTNAPLQEFLAADTVVIGVPFYNFTIASQLKAWIDHLMIPGQTFRYGENGPEGLAGGKRVILALASGGFYGEGSGREALEHAESYLRGVFGFIGVTDIEVVAAVGLKLDPEKRDDLVAAAVEQARAIEVPEALAA